MTESETMADVVELCALLQCVGFSVKQLDTCDNLSQEGADSKTIVTLNCQSSGIHVVLESGATSCSCPAVDQQNSGFWQVSGMSGGKQLGQESGSTLLRDLPKQYRERLSDQLNDIIRCIRALNDIEDGGQVLNKSFSTANLANKSASMVDLRDKSGSLYELSKEANKSASVLETATPEKRNLQLKADTPTRYRSLDTLTAAKDTKPLCAQTEAKKLTTSINRQSTYTIRSTPACMRRRNKTSSPIQSVTNTFLDTLIEAKKDAENLKEKIAAAIAEYVEEAKEDSSITSVLDVSKISVLKGPEIKAQFASSPNLSGLSTREDYTKSRLKRFESASTSNLSKPEETIRSKLRRLSPKMFNLRKDSTKDKDKGDGKSKLQNLFKPKIVTPIRTGGPKSESTASPFNASAKKKYSHIKSTIPRPTPTLKK